MQTLAAQISVTCCHSFPERENKRGPKQIQRTQTKNFVFPPSHTLPNARLLSAVNRRYMFNCSRNSDFDLLQLLILHYKPLVKETEVVPEINIKPRTSKSVTLRKVSRKTVGCKNKGQWHKIRMCTQLNTKRNLRKW
jgi:hypothetical protein